MQNNPRHNGAMSSMFGLNVVANEQCYREEFDWSVCRSPSRAKRRHAQGIRTRVKISHKPVAYLQGNTLHAHPTLVAEMRKEMLAAQQSTKLTVKVTTPAPTGEVTPATLEDLLAPFSQSIQQKRMQAAALEDAERAVSRLTEMQFSQLSIRPLKTKGVIADISI